MLTDDSELSFKGTEERAVKEQVGTSQYAGFTKNTSLDKAFWVLKFNFSGPKTAT